MRRRNSRNASKDGSPRSGGGCWKVTEETEERVFHLWALRLTGADAKAIDAARDALRKAQRLDGGWGQTPELGSDAYATGSALVVLHLAGGLPVEDSAYQGGLHFLLKSQRPDGSWHVVSRSKPFQVYFETGFPHGKDQFISMSASSWATTALALACPKPADSRSPR